MRQLFKIQIIGAVQGAGFRPFVYRLAKELGLVGYVQNTASGVLIKAEGDTNTLENFLLRIQNEKPAITAIHNLESSVHDVAGYSSFEILKSDQDGKKSATILPDIAICSECLQELFNEKDRRYRYPFINCTNCGPRFSIINAIPYDRPNTTMQHFVMCPACRKEYDDPDNRRFHAQPNACPVCGPHIELWNTGGEILSKNDDALKEAAGFIRRGKIVAFKSIGGFQLLVNATDEAAVNRLRIRKQRNEKPFAVLYPSLQMVKKDCIVSIAEERLLRSAASPIVLLERKKQQYTLAENIAPDNPYTGVMLPYTPLHHLLLHDLDFPVVATSGNFSDEPICRNEEEALDRLAAIADVFLVHNRPVARQVDDSVVRVVAGREQVLRRARGYAPLPVYLKNSGPQMIAVGAHLKNTIAVSKDKAIWVSQHIGDLETEPAYSAFKQVINDLKKLYQIEPEAVICDLHPEYLSTRYAHQLGVTVIKVQHHYAHVLSCMADNEVGGQVLGVCWDGTGYGTDGSIWGSEFLLTTVHSFERLGHFREFHLPGGEAAIKQARRTALGILYEIFGDEVFGRKDLIPMQSFSDQELKVIRQMLIKKINSPLTCSAGRLFDAIASIMGLCQKINFEGQAAMKLEFTVEKNVNAAYPFEIEGEIPCIINWEPMLLAIINDVSSGIPSGIIAARFHHTLSEIIVHMAKKAGVPRVVLTGGCFQNKYLTENTVSRLQEEGFQPYWHQRIPPNDGGIAVGQVLAAIKEHEYLIHYKKIETSRVEL